MSEPVLTQIDRFEAPYGREIVLQKAEFESGMHLLRVRIREGNRFTIIDIDDETAEHWAKAMLAWAGQSRGGASG